MIAIIEVLSFQTMMPRALLKTNGPLLFALHTEILPSVVLLMVGEEYLEHCLRFLANSCKC